MELTKNETRLMEGEKEDLLPTDFLEQEDILYQLAEEASELAKAALKKARIIRDANPTPVTIYEANDNLMEEIADVYNCINQLEDAYVDKKIVDEKEARWVDRLQRHLIAQKIKFNR